uniref:Uncharacterized protein n=1 Tax=Candidatus Kentrum sp. DK TaxID=2126562 RepID=A0A450SHN1_9GAMM|nr:MAG: hypothetical protein BECKDK2373C_GA0170839_103724 [Candidatus Kentron sp. DK]
MKRRLMRFVPHRHPTLTIVLVMFPSAPSRQRWYQPEYCKLGCYPFFRVDQNIRACVSIVEEELHKPDRLLRRYYFPPVVL